MAKRNPSALKAHRQNVVRRVRNRDLRSTLRTGLKGIRAALNAGKIDEAKTLLGAAVSLPARAQATTDRDAAFAAATQEYRTQHYAGAYGRFVRLADQGHAEAARIAWMMYRDGPVLFGTQWDASTPQLEAWAKLVVDAASRPALLAQAGE